MTASDEHSLDLAMPFVAVESMGGPYDDEAFAAGWACADMDNTLRWLEGNTVSIEVLVRPSLIEQYDLIAMRCGFSVAVKWENDENDPWCFLTISSPGTDTRLHRGA